jgi:hypothetical protein
MQRQSYSSIRLKPRRTLIETVGYQESLRDTLRNRIFIPGLEQNENPRDSKTERYIEMLEPIVAQHKLYIMGHLESNSYKGPMEDLWNEMTLFPKCRTRDLLDALYYACKRLRPPSHSLEVVRPKLPEYQQVYIDYYQREEDDTMPMYYEDQFN